MLQDDHWDSLLARMSIQADILDPLFVDLFKDRTTAELADEAQRRGIVMTPVLPPSGVRGADALRRAAARSSTPRRPPACADRSLSGFFEIDGERVGYRAPQPRARRAHRRRSCRRGGRHHGRLAARTPRRPCPFTGLKVLDFGHGGVGVETGRLFAEYGADVIKVETYTYPDFIRQVSGGMMSPSFASSSRGKRSFGVNVKVPSGLAVLKRLVEWADILIENTSTGTMDDMGIAVRACSTRSTPTS